MDGPLAGLRVLDIATIIAAPSAAAMLGDFGASVLKVELPGRGDGARSFPPIKDGKPLWWKVTNRGKQFITLDLRKPAGADLLLRIVADFDVLIENFRPGTLERWGLSADKLWAANPRLTILRVTGFGQTGPYRDRPGFARMFEAMGGLTHITGEPDGEPMHAGYPLADNIGGLFGAIGILAALYHRAQNPDSPGEEIDLALVESTMKLLEFLPIEYQQMGQTRQRSGNANQYSAPAAVFRTRDNRWVTLAGSTNALFAANCHAIGRPDLIDDPAFASNAQRVEHSAQLNAVFKQWFAQCDCHDALAAFEKAGGTLAPIHDIAQIRTDPQTVAREAICAVDDEDFGQVEMANVVPRMSRNPSRIRHTGRSIGHDSRQFYREVMGMSAEQIASLSEQGVI